MSWPLPQSGRRSSIWVTSALLAMFASGSAVGADGPGVGSPPVNGVAAATSPPPESAVQPTVAVPVTPGSPSPAGTSGHEPVTGIGSTAATPTTGAAATTDATPPVIDINKKEIQRIRPTGGAPATRPDGSVIEPAPTMDMGRVGLALAAVIGLILFLRWGSRKLMSPSLAGGSSHLMQVVARTPLAPRQQLLLVRVGQRLLVIGDSGGRLSGVGQIDDPDEVAAIVGKSRPTNGQTPAAAAFGGVFRRLSQGFGKKSGSGDWDDEDDVAPVATDTAGRSERQRLLDTLAPHADGPDEADPRRAGPATGRTTAGRPTPNGSPAGYSSETDAEAAVEAARADILALRAKLRAVTERLGGPTQDEGAPPDGAPPGPGPTAGERMADGETPRPNSRRVIEDPEA